MLQAHYDTEFLWKITTSSVQPFVSTALEVIERATPELRRMCLRMRPLDNLHVTAAYWTDIIPEEYQQK